MHPNNSEHPEGILSAGIFKVNGNSNSQVKCSKSLRGIRFSVWKFRVPIGQSGHPNSFRLSNSPSESFERPQDNLGVQITKIPCYTPCSNALKYFQASKITQKLKFPHNWLRTPFSHLFCAKTEPSHQENLHNSLIVSNTILYWDIANLRKSSTLHPLPL